MGGNVSRQTEDGTIQAFTFYGLGCDRCSRKQQFVPGAPAASGCGTSAGAVHFTPPVEYADALQEMRDDLTQAAIYASEEISWTSSTFFTTCDTTTLKAAEKVNAEWCKELNEGCLGEAGLYCHAAAELFGFGRTRQLFLVIRVYALPSTPKAV